MSSHPASSQGGASEIITGPAANVLREQQAGQQAKEGQAGFADQVKGYAKEFAGKASGKEHEQAQGQAVRKGELSTEEAKSAYTK